MSPADHFHGPVFIGTLFNMMLYGIMITQMYLYYTTYKRDPIWIKLFVLAVFVVDTVNTLFDIMFVYLSLVKHFDDVEFLKKPNWCFASDPATTGIVELMVQVFFAWRIRVLTGSRAMSLCIVFLAFVGSVCALIVTSQIFVVPSFARFGDFKNYVIGWLASAVVADVIITTVLVTYLHKTGFRQSDMVVDRIIRVTMSTGLLASMVAVVDLTVYLINPSGIDLMLNLLLCKLYSNSLMSSLNSRRGWRHSDTTASIVTGNRTLLSEGIIFSEDGRSPSVGSAADISKRPAGTKASTLFDPRRQFNTTVGRSGPEVFVHVESHEVRDSLATSATMAPSPPPSIHKNDVDLEADAVTALSLGGIREPVGRTLSSPV